MAEAVFRAPRRKKKVFESYEAAFPVLTSQGDTNVKDFRICNAEIHNNNVIVRNPEDIEHLYGKGYFGKGILSRSRPEYNISDPELTAQLKGYNMNMPVITSNKYWHHVEWAKSLLKGQGLNDEVANSILENYIKPLELPLEKEVAKLHTELHNEPDTGKEDGEEAMSTVTFNGDSVSANSEDQSQGGDRKKLCLEGHPAHDPLAKYGLDVLNTVDKEALARIHCQRHDDFILYCGCKTQEGVTPMCHDPSRAKEHDLEYVLVQEEANHQRNDEEEAKGKLVKTEKLVCRRNPFRLFEYLQLSLEEAFFLVYALGCLTVCYSEEPLTILKLWEVFSIIQPSFQTIYMAYHYFRSKGWVPKVGLKYGTDLLLYRKGPPFYHASYSVIVELVDDHFQGTPRRPFTWKTLAGLNRTTLNVSKELLFCYLIKPSDMSEQEMLSPECMKRIKVQELIVSRWVSSRERTEQEEL
ncbi:tRNA-splicing endonuclease subunit Sen2 [Microcaecilia unicolor]|uniref:tRNA-splicing endonuclease subunit Sen2 n=1 Tax=Microcaecilia unicolor TaxID=1415580 RepID=A0A6P7ZVW7_9AMPH|nr:tRNA-splicing endonuclease subunit Sen2 [Microcaecilia unicolor]XP_030077974.1 tRNA-splicing endonuclease subunit Sen2 [Microcaecilia unicolor]XP_030077983.1 tRNA-splicing endonuclease subunit Sen2 [Microcaecilia unicolor]XP_030077988.1 tRNA-splicing endonuclease subunit Sen2 [Microcaecilia unicolor]